MTVQLIYWKHGRTKLKKFKTVEKARAFGQKILMKDGYDIHPYGSIHVYSCVDGLIAMQQLNLFE